jgi:propane monooxygenase reductase subunit
MPDSDLVVELLHFDPDNYRLDSPIRDGRATVAAVEALTHDIRRLELEVREPADFSFTPGQYVDLWVPGTDARRSFSMANLPGDGRIELIIKRYPGGRFSSLLDGGLAPPDEVSFTGPYGAFRLRDSDRPVLMVAGGSGMAPILSLLRQMSAGGYERGLDRMVRFFYGARAQRDLFYLDLVVELGSRIPDFGFVPVLSDADPEDRWDGALPLGLGFVHEVVDSYLDSGEMEQPDVYMCGPPPMIDAASELLVERHGVDESRIFYDKFTTSADAEEVADDPLFGNRLGI